MDDARRFHSCAVVAAAFRRLPYNLVLSLITSPKLHYSHLDVCSRAASIMRNLYIDNDIWPETPLEYHLPSGAPPASDVSLEDAEETSPFARVAAMTPPTQEAPPGGQKPRGAARIGGGQRTSG